MIEANCLEIKDPKLNSKAANEKVSGMENIKTWTLANLDQSPKLIKLDNLIKDNFNKSHIDLNDLNQDKLR